MLKKTILLWSLIISPLFAMEKETFHYITTYMPSSRLISACTEAQKNPESERYLVLVWFNKLLKDHTSLNSKTLASKYFDRLHPIYFPYMEQAIKIALPNHNDEERDEEVINLRKAAYKISN